ncbi:MAG TPA: glycosyltransferase family 2 protein, partial [Polyangium sp.]|nr:glycosyltransferase family 2 protein [Polyangium sp.]
IVIPAMNEERRLPRTLRRVVAYLRDRPESWEVIVVDDGSRDRTAEVVEELARELDEPRLSVLKLPKNQGKGGAQREGVAHSRGDRVLLMDADLATPIEELEPLWKAIDRGADIAIGSRALATSNITRPQSLPRVLLGSAGNLWIRFFAVSDIRDTQCGFKLFRGDLARKLFAVGRENRFAIDIELLCLAQRVFHADIAEIGVRWEHQDLSSVRWRDYVDVLARVARIGMRIPKNSRSND